MSFDAAAIARYAAEKIIDWITEHLGRAIWIVLIVGLTFVLVGATISEIAEWRAMPGNSSADILNVFSEKPFEVILGQTAGRTIEALGIEVIGSVIVAIGFLLLRDANREKIDLLERKIDQLQDSQAQLLVLAMMAAAQNQTIQSVPMVGAQNQNSS